MTKQGRDALLRNLVAQILEIHLKSPACLEDVTILRKSRKGLDEAPCS